MMQFKPVYVQYNKSRQNAWMHGKAQERPDAAWLKKNTGCNPADFVQCDERSWAGERCWWIMLKGACRHG